MLSLLWEYWRVRLGCSNLIWSNEGLFFLGGGGRYSCTCFCSLCCLHCFLVVIERYNRESKLTDSSMLFFLTEPTTNCLLGYTFCPFLGMVQLPAPIVVLLSWIQNVCLQWRRPPPIFTLSNCYFLSFCLCFSPLFFQGVWGLWWLDIDSLIFMASFPFLWLR